MENLVLKVILAVDLAKNKSESFINQIINRDVDLHNSFSNEKIEASDVALMVRLSINKRVLSF